MDRGVTFQKLALFRIQYAFQLFMALYYVYSYHFLISDTLSITLNRNIEMAI